MPPCDQIIINTTDFAAAKNHVDILAEAMRSMGYTVTRAGEALSFYGRGYNGTYSNGKFRSREGFESQTDEIKQAFGKQVVRAAAKRYGWSVQERGNKMQIRKRA